MGPLASGPSFLFVSIGPQVRLPPDWKHGTPCVAFVTCTPQDCEPFVMFVRYARSAKIFHGFNGTAPRFQERRKPGRTRR